MWKAQQCRRTLQHTLHVGWNQAEEKRLFRKALATRFRSLTSASLHHQSCSSFNNEGTIETRSSNESLAATRSPFLGFASITIAVQWHFPDSQCSAINQGLRGSIIIMDQRFEDSHRQLNSLRYRTCVQTEGKWCRKRIEKLTGLKLRLQTGMDLLLSPFQFLLLKLFFYCCIEFLFRNCDIAFVWTWELRVANCCVWFMLRIFVNSFSCFLPLLWDFPLVKSEWKKKRFDEKVDEWKKWLTLNRDSQ